ncbi:Uncharacterised protein [[Pasteurella] aerogenes]|nr:Uncharacterised protein [[Pasteurella] aerogenes]
MRSFVIGYTTTNGSTTSGRVDANIHINLWAHANGDNINYYFDFGFMVEDISIIKEIILYCPFRISKVSDLGKCLSQDRNLLGAIFNQKCEINSYEGQRERIVLKSEEIENNTDESFILYKLSDSKFNHSYIDDGYSKLTIDCDAILSQAEIDNEQRLKDNKKYYFRLRIKPESVHNFIKIENSKFNILRDPSLHITEIIDFRINELRSCPDELKEDFLTKKTFKIKSVHYLIIRCSTDDFINVDGKSVTSRLLENEIWQDYLPENDKRDMIAYHFKQKSKNEGGDSGIIHYTNLSQFRYLSDVPKRLVCYVFIGVLIAIFTSLLYDCAIIPLFKIMKAYIRDII